MASNIARASFLASLASIYPLRTPQTHNPWYIVAAVAYCASNRPEGVPRVFEYVAERAAGHDERLVLARKLRDAVFKSGLTCGYPRAINALVALDEVMPEELRAKEPLRNLDTPMDEYVQMGKTLFGSLYGETAASVQGLLDTIYPDMGWFSNTVGYGVVYGCMSALSQAETSYTLVAALIASDTPRQIAWHLDGAMRGGATRAEVCAVRAIAIDVARECGVVWRNEVPEVMGVAGK